MSQFNSIFSPLTNKLARLAGITLLAVAALFASTQQIAAQGGPIGTTTCVTSLEVRLGENCQSTVTSTMVLVGTSTLYDVRINDLNPANGGIVDGVSPASGWSYGVYVSNAANAALICQGVIYAVDYTAPSVVAPAAVDFISDDISEVLDKPLSWGISSTGAADRTGTWFAGNLLETLNGFADVPSRTDSTLTITDNCSMPVSIRVTDKIDYTECTGAVYKTHFTIWATITRSFQATDRRGNDTTVTQIIRFLRPLLASLDSLAGPAAGLNASGSASYGRINGVNVFSTNGLSGSNANKYGSGVNSADTIVFNNCTPPSGTGADLKANLRPYLRDLYRVGYVLPNDTKTDTNYVFGNAANTIRFGNYNADFTVTEFPTCNGGRKFKITTTFMDLCPNGVQPMLMDDVILVFEDRSKPVFEANTTTINGILGLTVGAPVQISVGTNDCTASLRLGTQTSLRDLASVFNVKVTDSPTGCASAVTLSYRFETKDYWNNNFFVAQPSWVVTNYTTISTTLGNNVIGLPVGNHRVTITATDQCNNQQPQTLYFDVVDKVAPVMKCDDLINVTLSSNFSSNYFIDGAGGGISDRDVTNDARARVYVSDINEGSRDNCTLDSLYVRRKVDWTSCQNYLKLNLDYDIFGNNDGFVTAADFVDGYTPVGMQYVEIFCCDIDNVMFELWGSDMKHYNNSNVSGGNWSFCWGTINRENKVSPTLSEPNHAATYNAGTRNWIQCTDKDWIGDSQLNGGSMGTNDWITVTTAELAKNTYDEKLGRISNVRLSNATFGMPDIYGMECTDGDVKYKVVKNLTCDTGVILRIWQVEKTIKAEPLTKITLRDTQIIWVQANHDYRISVPADKTVYCEDFGTLPGVTFDEDGCDLLAISTVTDKVYQASATDNACKKVYRTSTVINWCQVPNQFLCANADPFTYARVIPRMQTNTLAAANTETGSAKAATHWFQKLAPTATGSLSNNVRTGGSGQNSGIDPTRGHSDNATVWLASNNTARRFPDGAVSGTTNARRSVNAAAWTTSGAATLTYPVLNPALNGCASVGEQTFAWQYTQIIKVQDTTKPYIVNYVHNDLGVSDDVNWNGTVFGLRGNNADNILTFSGPTGIECQARVSMKITVDDACNASQAIELDTAIVVRKASPLSNTGLSNVVTVSPLDPADDDNDVFTLTVDGLEDLDRDGSTDYEFIVTLRDDCGNVSSRRVPFTVADIKAPAPVCVQNLVVTLMPTNVGGNPAGGSTGPGMVIVRAKDVFQDINRVWDSEECTIPTGGMKARIVKITATTPEIKTAAQVKALPEEIMLTCEDLRNVTGGDIRVYLIDGADNFNYCRVSLDLQDNINICSPTGSAAVAGAIQTESKATVEGVQVNLSGQSQKSFATGVNGLFVFNNLTAGADYTVTPSLNKGFLNGVSTFDLVLISKHILGVQPLNTPYKLIAADVNNSKSVTTLDLIQLRKLILNIDATFANNSSWRFVDASYTFPNASNPWAASFPEVKNVNDLVGSLSANFVAVKVGDVNGNAIANSTQGSVRNLTSNLGINVADMNMVAGNEYKVDFTAADLNGIEGFQFTLNLDKKGLELVDLVPGIAAEENFGIFAEEGVVTASWNGEAKGGVLFSLVVRAKSNTTLSEVLNLNSRYTAAEAYKGGEVVNVGLNFNAAKASANYELYQNTPNPFAGESIIGFNLPAAGSATLTIQDVTGRTLKVINGQYAKGYNQVSLKSTELTATGVLTYTLKAADFTATRKMIIVE